MAPGAAYSVEVYFAGETAAREHHRLASGQDVLPLIPQLLAQHPDCERIAVHNGMTFLFAVDCKGNPLARK